MYIHTFVVYQSAFNIMWLLWVVLFGMALAQVQAIFQQTMESLLQGLSDVCVYLNNLQVSGSRTFKSPRLSIM